MIDPRGAFTREKERGREMGEGEDYSYHLRAVTPS